MAIHIDTLLVKHGLETEDFQGKLANYQLPEQISIRILKSSFPLKLGINASVKSKHRTFDDMVKLLIQERKEGDILHEGVRINTVILSYFYYV